MPSTDCNLYVDNEDPIIKHMKRCSLVLFRIFHKCQRIWQVILGIGRYFYPADYIYTIYHMDDPQIFITKKISGRYRQSQQGNRR